MSYVIGNNYFSTKQEIIKKTQSILNTTTDNQEVSGRDYDFLIELFKNHSEWKQKSGNNFSGITVGKSLHGTRCFYLKTDIGLEDISFHHAVKCIKK
ncbi:DUF3223 domain-containing protein [Pectobacterium odoriferum]|uniref:DUF3223 domain-containing protein n=1 Tax=Pectobacterium odoriferum TaxID=78398 RepID=UPI000CD1F9DC|nr:DUF3223 domain-containing protein [Pectobacterium odoriferum]POE05749.1 hypothetical protein BV916_03660 [Pectobacterium odoriferum]